MQKPHESASAADHLRYATSRARRALLHVETAERAQRLGYSVLTLGPAQEAIDEANEAVAYAAGALQAGR